jgi:hypothetical protein
MADRERLFVSPAGMLWKVQWEGGRIDNHYQMQEAAISRARTLVGSLPAGTCSQILVQRPDGQFRTEWTYGKDPFPPVG